MFRGLLQRRLKGNVLFRHRGKGKGGDVRLSVDAPLSRKEILMMRRKWTLAGLKWGAVLAVGLWCVNQASEMWRREFVESRAYAVGDFLFSSNGVITAKQVAQVTGLRPDQNVTHVDLRAVRESLLALPRVSAAEVERRLPNRLSIRLEERRPVAWLACVRQGIHPHNSRGLLLDENGVAFLCETVLNEYTSLPVIMVPDLGAVTPGRRVEEGNVERALELAKAMRGHKWQQPMRLEQVHVTNRFTLMAQMDTDAIFTFRPEHIDTQLEKLDAILRDVEKKGRKVGSVNLQLARNIPVTLSDDAPAAALPAVKRGGKTPAPAPRTRRASGRPSASTGGGSSTTVRGA